MGGNVVKLMDTALGRDRKDVIIKSPKAVFQLILEDLFCLQLEVGHRKGTENLTNRREIQVVFWGWFFGGFWGAFLARK